MYRSDRLRFFYTSRSQYSFNFACKPQAIPCPTAYEPWTRRFLPTFGQGRVVPTSANSAAAQAGRPGLRLIASAGFAFALRSAVGGGAFVGADLGCVRQLPSQEASTGQIC